MDLKSFTWTWICDSWIWMFRYCSCNKVALRIYLIADERLVHHLLSPHVVVSSHHRCPWRKPHRCTRVYKGIVFWTPITTLRKGLGFRGPKAYPRTHNSLFGHSHSDNGQLAVNTIILAEVLQLKTVVIQVHAPPRIRQNGMKCAFSAM